MCGEVKHPKHELHYYTRQFFVFQRTLCIDLYCKCLPILLYCTKTCKLTNANNIQSFDFAVNKFFMKPLKTTNIDIIRYCQEQFDFKLLSELSSKRSEKFHSQIAGFNSLQLQNVLCETSCVKSNGYWLSLFS